MKTILATLMTLMAGVALAAKECSSWAQVRTALEAGDSVKLTQNMNADSVINPWGDDLTIDMNGKTVTRIAPCRLFDTYRHPKKVRLTDSVGGGNFMAGSVTCPYLGGFALVYDNVTFQIDGNVTIDGFKSEGSGYEGRGGAFWVQSSGSLVMNNGTIKNGSANTDGGAVFLNGGSFTMNGGTISGCTQSGIYVSGGEFTMNGGTISGCTGVYGGGVHVGNGGTVELNGGTISGCRATYGAAFALYGSGTVNVRDGMTISGNSNGGHSPVFLQGGTINVWGGKFTGNSSSQGQGVMTCWSGVFNVYGGVVTGNSIGKPVQNCTVYGLVSDQLPEGVESGYTATQVGTKWVVGQSMYWSDTACMLGTFTFNIADQIYKDQGLSVMSGSSCHEKDGKYLVRPDAVHKHCVCGSTTCSGEGHDPNQVWEPTAELPTTAGYWYLVAPVTTSQSWSPPSGVSLCLNGKAVTKTGSGRVCNCTSLTLTDCQTTPGKLTGGNNIVSGGAICVNSGGVVYLYRIEISGNSATDGGGVNVNRGGTCRLHSGKICGNTSPKGGGGVCNLGTFNMLGGEISGNTADYGGGVRMSSGTFTLSGGEIKNNHSKQNGNGVQAHGTCTFKMTGGNISGNSDVAGSSAYGGGGVLLYEGVTAELTGGEIVDNTTEGSGGGIYFYGTKLTLGGVKVARNSAKPAGGGVYVGAGTVTMSGGDISGNTVTAGQSGWDHIGGGVCVQGGTFELTNGTISGNTAPSGGGVGLNNGATLTMSGGVVSENTTTHWGGGVAIHSGGKFTLSGGEIVKNVGEGVHSSGNFTMTDGVIRDNTGRALYFDISKDKTISGGLVLGAQYVASGTTSFYGGVFDVSPSTVASGYEMIPVGSYYTVAQAGTGASAGGILTAGHYRFDPCDTKYAKLGIVSMQNFYSAKIGTNPDLWQLTARKAIDCATWPEVRSNLSAGNSVRLTENITVPSDGGAVTVPSGNPQTLDLGGNVITSQLTTALFDLKTAGAALTVSGDGRIVNGASGEAAHHGGCFNVTAGSLELEGGTYEGFRVKTGYHGGCVYVGSGASFALTGGVISNCWAGGAGGAVASAGTSVISGGLLTWNSAANPGGAVAALGGEMVVAGGEFAENGRTAKGDAAPANGAALAAVESASLTVAGGWFQGNATQAADEKTGTGAAVYLKLKPAGSAQILGGLFGENRMGGYDEIMNVLVDKSQGGDMVTVAGGFFCRQNPSTLSAYLSSDVESVSVRPAWWVLGLRKTVSIANDRVNEGTFTFDPMGEACYLLEELVASGSRTLYTPATAERFATWQLTSIADETLSFECHCPSAGGTVPTGLHMVRTYLTTADGDATSETNRVVVRFDPNGYYASQTSLDICGFFERYGEAYLAIDVCTEDGATVIHSEPRQKIGFVPYALHASRAESVKLGALTAESLTVSNSARIGTLTASAALAVTQSAVITNGASDMEGKISKMTIDRLNLAGAGTSLLEPIGGMPLAPSARAGWTRVASSATGLLRQQDGTVTKTVTCPYDGVFFITCETADGGALDLTVTRSGDSVGKEEVFAQKGLVAPDGKGYDLSTVVVRGDRVTIEAAAKGEGTATVAYRYVTFGAPREEK